MTYGSKDLNFDAWGSAGLGSSQARGILVGEPARGALGAGPHDSCARRLPAGARRGPD